LVCQTIAGVLAAACMTLALSAAAQTTDSQTGYWGDQGDGSYRNPILAGDYSDPDVIRVGEDFYMISSTINMSPGMVVLHSRDLVNWTTISHVVADTSQLGPTMNWDRMDRYNTGIYAGSIRYHAGVYFVHFTSFLEGLFVATATNPAGPWRVRPMLDRQARPLLAPRWLDLCPFWDDDGSAYLVASKPNGAWYPHLFRMSADGVTLLDADLDAMLQAGPQPSGQGAIIYARPSAEGNKIYKRGDFYYFFNNEVAWRGRVPMIRRSRFIYGQRADGSPGTPNDPGAYETRPLLATTAEDREQNQGGLVDTPDGRWFFLTHGGAGGHADGRVVSLLPVNWNDGWPVAGVDRDHDGVGEMSWSGGAIPVPGLQQTYPQGSDGFDAATLNARWEWNHQPRAEMWSLSERRGWLRLRAFAPAAPGGFFRVGNLLGQRYLSGDSAVATFAMDLSGMADGQRAGLAHFNGGRNYAAVQVSQSAGQRALEYEQDGEGLARISIPARTRRLWLRTAVDRNHLAAFAYSIDGREYHAVGNSYLLQWGGYRGDYIGVFTYNASGERGYIDIDRFDYEIANRESRR
jgi:beta-xylosidase